MATKEELITWLDEAHRQIEDLVAQVEIQFPIYSDPIWTIREILAHFAGWDDAIIGTLKAHQAGEVPPVPAPRGPDVYNAATITERESLSYDHIYREWQASHETLKIVINSLSPEKLDEPVTYPWGQIGSLEDLIRMLSTQHKMEHAKDIAALLENK